VTLTRPCLACSTPCRPGPRCVRCEAAHQSERNASRPQYRGDYAKRSAQVRAEASVCWLCGEGERASDPWQADHLRPADPASPLLPAHRSCNAARGNRAPG
jgi:hypothetical protein